MPRVTLIREDNTALVGGKAHRLDLSALPAEIDVVQWNEEKQRGWIEFVQDPDEPHRPNETIESFEQFQKFRQQWQDEDDKANRPPSQEEIAQREERRAESEAQRRLQQEMLDRFADEVQRNPDEPAELRQAAIKRQDMRARRNT